MQGKIASIRSGVWCVHRCVLLEKFIKCHFVRQSLQVKFRWCGIGKRINRCSMSSLEYVNTIWNFVFFRHLPELEIVLNRHGCDYPIKIKTKHGPEYGENCANNLSRIKVNEAIGWTWWLVVNIHWKFHDSECSSSSGAHFVIDYLRRPLSIQFGLW